MRDITSYPDKITTYVTGKILEFYFIAGLEKMSDKTFIWFCDNKMNASATKCYVIIVIVRTPLPAPLIKGGRVGPFENRVTWGGVGGGGGTKLFARKGG